jgi:hypothetical protein
MSIVSPNASIVVTDIWRATFDMFWADIKLLFIMELIAIKATSTK